MNKIELLLNKKGWTKYELAKRADIPQSTISQLFSRNNQPTISTLESICMAFGLTMSEFFTENGDERHLTAEQVLLLNKWSELTEEQKEMLMKFINSL